MNLRVFYIDHADSHRICSCILAGNDRAHQRSGVQVGYARVTSRGPRAYSTGLPNLDIFSFSRRIVVIEPAVHYGWTWMYVLEWLCLHMYNWNWHLLLSFPSSPFLALFSWRKKLQRRSICANASWRRWNTSRSFSLSLFLRSFTSTSDRLLFFLDGTATSRHACKWRGKEGECRKELAVILSCTLNRILFTLLRNHFIFVYSYPCASSGFGDQCVSNACVI